MSDPAMTSRWVVRQCSYCDEHGYLPNGFRCTHEPPETVAERARRGANLARAALGKDLAADTHQPEEADA